ncbi:hypothetical protein FACS189440_19330 [Bacteroidia bacterium]|nr:hypothetical protein FACS189423_07170 [Bacteroidia bacterium]GHT50977.1 hypothetical protein FACS189440_19330 [Bacteroidia bacterium]
MKNLDLNAYGVMEMNQQELLNENGGGISDFMCNSVKTWCAIVVVACEKTQEVAQGIIEGIG